MDHGIRNYVVKVLLDRYNEITLCDYDNNEEPINVVARDGYEHEVDQLKTAIKQLVQELLT